MSHLLQEATHLAGYQSILYNSIKKASLPVGTPFCLSLAPELECLEAQLSTPVTWNVVVCTEAHSQVGQC